MASYDDKQTDKALEELQQRIIENYQNAYDEISKTAADYWRDFMPRYNEERKAYEAGKGGYADEKTAKAKFDAWTLAQYGRGERWDNLRDKIATRLNDANKTASAYIKDTTPGIYELNANYSAYLIEEATGVDFTLYDERTVADLIQGKTQILPPSKVNDAKTNAYIQNQLTKAVTSGILQGQPIDKIAKQFERVTQMNANAAIRNARTAVTSAQNAGRQDTYERAAEMGIEIEKEWIATIDKDTRESHAELDGVRVKIDELYPNLLNYPADPSGAPEEVYNCRCTQRAIITKYNGEARETKIDGHEGIHTKATYEKWKADKIAAQPPTTHADATARAMEAKEDAQEAAAEKMAAAEPETVEENKAELSQITNDEEKAQAWYDTLTDEQKSSIEWYVSGDGMEANDYLRGRNYYRNHEADDYLIDQIANLSNTISSYGGLAEDQTLYRNVDISAILGNVDYNTLSNYIYGFASDKEVEKIEGVIGKTITDKGFMSTTTDKDLALNWGDFTGSENPCIIEFSAHKGDKAANLKAFDIEEDPQNEFLFAPNTKYKITDISYSKDNGQFYIKAELI